jgi:hypothetical protein
MNSFVVPTFWDLRAFKNFSTVMLNIKRVVILGCVFLGYTFAVTIGEYYSLVDIGLKSFEAVTIFAPSMLLGLYWKGGNKKGAIAGIIAGFSVWIYTLLIPALMRAGIIEPRGVMAAIFNSRLLNPTALFGLVGLDRWSHSLFWGLLLNLLSFVGVSIFTRQSDAETRQAIIFVDSYSPLQFSQSHRPVDIATIEDILGQYIGKHEAREAVDGFLKKNSIARKSITNEWLLKLREEAERILSGALGPSISTLVFQNKMVLTHDDAAGTRRREPAACYTQGVQREHHRKPAARCGDPRRVAARDLLEQRYGDDNGRGKVRRIERTSQGPADLSGTAAFRP